jgi:MATE family multidrug resistance protein
MKQYMAHYRQNLKIAMPVVLGQLGHIAVGVSDSIMVGHVGAIPLAAVSVATGLFGIMLVMGLGFSFGLTPLIAAADGKEDLAEVRVLFKNGTLLNISLGLVFILLFVNLLPLMHYLKQSPAVVEQAVPFLELLLWSLLPIMVYQSFKQFAEGLSYTFVAMCITLAATLLNILLNYVWVYGHWGFEPMGIRGSGWATFVARTLMALAMFLYVWFATPFRKYRFSWDFADISWPRMAQLLKMGIPVSLQMTFEVGAFAVAAILVGHLGTTEQAAHQVALSLASVTYMMASGLGAAATVRVGHSLGSGDFKNGRLAGFTSLHIVVLFMMLMALIFTVGRTMLPAFYTTDSQVIEVASSLLIIAAFFQISDGVQVVGLGALRGLADVRIPTAITLVAYWVLGLPVGYVLATYFNMGVYGIWYGLLLGLSVAAILLTLRFNQISKRMVRQQETLIS